MEPDGFIAVSDTMGQYVAKLRSSRMTRGSRLKENPHYVNPRLKVGTGLAFGQHRSEF